MRWVLASLCWLGVGPWLAPAAQAQSLPQASHAQERQPASYLSVTRDEGAERCPDTEALRIHVDRLRGDQATSEPSAYRVHFSQLNGVFRADINGPGGGTRVLRDRRATCASLEQATALTLALLLDSDASQTLPEKVEPEPARRRVTEPERAADRATPARRARAAHLAFSLGGGALFGVTRPVAPIVQAELGLGVNRFRAGIGVMWMPTQTRGFGPGQLQETLLSGEARTCLAVAGSAQLRMNLCSGVYVGVLKVQAQGYTRDDSADKAWLAVPVGVSLTTTPAPVGVEVGASVLLPLRRRDFAIDNLGVAYESWPVAMLLSMRAVGSWLL